MDWVSILHHLPIPVARIKNDGTVVYANPAASKYLGNDAKIPLSLQELRNHLPARWETEVEGGKCALEVTEVREGEEAVLIFQDLTELISTRKALQEAQDRFHALIEGLSHAVSIIQEVDGIPQHVFINEAFTENTGYTLEDLKGKPFYEMIDPVSRPLLMERARKRLEGDRGHGYYEFRMTKKDGTPMWIRLVSSLIVYGGKPAILASAHDITDLKEAKDVLRQANERFQNILNALPFATFAIDLAGRVIGWNKTMEYITGTPVSEVMGKGERVYSFSLYGDKRPILIDKVLNPDVELGDTYSDVTFRGDVWYARGFMKDSKGVESFFLAMASPLRDSNEQIIGAVESIIDITRQYAAEKALKASEERFRALAEETPDVVMLFDRELRHLYCNKAITRYTKLPPEAFIGKTHRELNFPPGRVDEVEEALREVLRTGRTQRKQLAFENGSTFDWLLAPIASPEGIVTHVITTARDISELRKMEEVVVRAEKMEAIGNLAGGIAHDFNNVLQAIMGYATLIHMNQPEGSDDFTRSQLIINAATSAMELIRRLLGFARSTPGKVEPLDVNEEVATVAQMYGRTKKEIEIHLKLESELPTIEVDRVGIEQVILNILVNAGQAMPEGGDIYIETSSVIIDERTARVHKVSEGPFVRIAITDTGIGMDEVTLSRIFEPFFTTKAPGEGTGLGLTTAYGVVRAHRGFINVYSERGHGTTFSIYLPASDERKKERAEVRETIPRGSETVLVVDDELPVLDVAADILTYLGYRVFKAASGEEAIRIYRDKSGEIDLVLLDMIMPRMNGKEVFLKLKEINPSVCVCITSGYTQTPQAQEIIDLGVRGFIYKPYTIRDLAHRMREILA